MATDCRLASRKCRSCASAIISSGRLGRIDAFPAYDALVERAGGRASHSPARMERHDCGWPSAADCAACHTVPGGAPFGGGLSFKLPFGTIYSTNITADRETGIGTWSDDDFVRALHQGIAKDGTHLYPAFPYTSYTGMTRDDAVAIKAYLFSLAPARPDALCRPVG
jgi:hypothetical protein